MRGLIMALGVVAMVAAPGVAGAADITVQRGDTEETVRVAGAGPTVLRGGGTMRAKPPKENAVGTKRAAYAGNTLWFVANNEPVTACFLIRTEYVGQRKIRCTRARY